MPNNILENMNNLSPKYRAEQDFKKGLNENDYPLGSKERKEYDDAWYDRYLIGLKVEQQPNFQ